MEESVGRGDALDPVNKFGGSFPSPDVPSPDADNVEAPFAGVKEISPLPSPASSSTPNRSPDTPDDTPSSPTTPKIGLQNNVTSSVNRSHPVSVRHSPAVRISVDTRPSGVRRDIQSDIITSPRAASFKHGDSADSSLEDIRDIVGSAFDSGSEEKDVNSDLNDVKNNSLCSYFYSEMTRGYWLEHDEARYAEKRKRVYTFMKIPREVEKFMTYGFFQCLDAFLYLFTFLPLRFFLASVHLSVRSCLLSCWSSPRRILEPAQICDILKGLVLILCCVLLNYVDVSMMYHLIRGQAIIKLYIFFNMLEVADRLFSSFGQDILDSLFWTATEPRGRKREHFGVIPHLILAVFYVFMHAILVLFQATTLNVAFNSHNKALMTIMMSNNFVELKGSVFKKFEKNNLFQMSCSDVRERFHLIVLLGIVGVRNMTEFSWNMDHLMVLIPDIFLVLLSEFLVDWVKHAFITKFNDISSDVYREYTVSIAYDLANSRQKNAFSDLVDVVSRRMGFIPLPLAALLIRVVVPLIRFKGWVTYAVISVGFLCLLSAKVLCSILLLGKSAVYIQESKDRGAQLDPVKIARSKSFSEAKITKPLLPDLDKEQNLENGLKRSHSVGSRMNSPASSPTKDRTSAEEELQSRNSDSISQKILFSNSTVSLQSVGLNEDYVKDKSTHNAEMVLSKRHVHGLTPEKNEKPARVQKPLSEIDRYTMCSNRII